MPTTQRHRAVIFSDIGSTSNKFLWTLSILTIPGREHFLQQLLSSLNQQKFHSNALITVVYNTIDMFHQVMSTELGSQFAMLRLFFLWRFISINVIQVLWVDETSSSIFVKHR